MEKIIEKWSQFRTGYIASEIEIAELLTEAEIAKDAKPWDWIKLTEVLTTFSGLNPKQVSKEVQRCRIRADLGGYPYTVQDFIPMFLGSRGYIMDFNGVFRSGKHETDNNYITNQMIMWSKQTVPEKTIFQKDLMESAFSIWQHDEKERLLKTAFASVAFDPKASDKNLKAFASYITATAEDEETTARNIRATEVALSNFIYRVKNHMRGNWKHSCHLMPVLFGPQGSCKSTAVETLLSPLKAFSSAASFDIFGDNSREYELSVMPVMFFEEMAGISKAEVEKIKGVMTLERRPFRQIYERTSVRTIVSSFIGCSNKDIGTLIRDETGNRRFIQIETPVLDRAAFAKFDVLAIWRCVDENAAEPPLYATQPDLLTVKAVQSEQSHSGTVQTWIEEYDRFPVKAVRAPELFAEHYHPWLERMFPHQAKFADLNGFRKELERLRGVFGHSVIVRTRPQNVVHYRIDKPVSEAREKVRSIIREVA